MYAMNLVTFWVDRMNIRKKVFRTATALLLSVGAVQLASAGAIVTQDHHQYGRGRQGR